MERRLGGLWPRLVAFFLLFIAINVLAAHRMSDCGLLAVIRVDTCADDMVRAGWPLKFFEAGGLASQHSLSLPGLAADTLIGALLAFVLARASLQLTRS